jgi:hypothetical protein
MCPVLLRKGCHLGWFIDKNGHGTIGNVSTWIELSVKLIRYRFDVLKKLKFSAIARRELQA